MKFISEISLILVLSSVQISLQLAIPKRTGLLPEPGQDCGNGETTQIPDVANVRNKDTTSLRLSLEPSLISKLKRCARSEIILGKSHDDATLPLARRDVTLQRQKHCERCRNTTICKDRGICIQCRIVCANVNTTAALIQDIDSNVPTTAPVTNTITEGIPDENTIVSSRFGEEENISYPKYYTVGSIESGSLKNILAKMFNVENNFDKFLILGQTKNGDKSQTFNQIIIFDLAHIFGDDNETVADIQRFTGDINTLRSDFIQELDTELDKAIERKKQETNGNQLSKEEIREIIEQVINEVIQKQKSVGNVEAVAPTDPSVQMIETETKCSVDEAVEDILDIMPVSNRAKEPKIEVEQEEESKTPAKNPPVIQDNLNVVGQDLDGYVDDNEEARPSLVTENIPSKPKPLKKYPKIKIPNEVSPVNNIVGDTEETQILDGPVEQTPQLESDNQLISESPVQRQNLEDNVFKIVKDSLKTVTDLRNDDNQPTNKDGVMSNQVAAPEETQILNIPVGQPVDLASDNQLISESPLARENLENNVIETVEDSLKNVNDLTAVDDTVGQEELANEEPVLIEDDEKRKSSQGSADDTIKSFEIPDAANEFDVQNNVEILEQSENNDRNLSSPEDADVSDSKQIENIDVPKATTIAKVEPSNNQVIQITDSPNVAEIAPDFENRDQFVDEPSTQEKLASFGSLVPATNMRANDENLPMKKIFFVGKDIKLPLQMYQDKDGVMKLKVDMETLCNCKNKDCPRKHRDSREIIEAPTGSPTNTRLERSQLIDSFVDSLYSHNSEIFKRSPKIDEDNDEISKINGLHKFEKNQKKPEQLSRDTEKYNEQNQDLLNKGTMNLFKNLEKTKNVQQMIELANNMLLWFKEITTKHSTS